MKIKYFIALLTIALSACATDANAQTAYTEGTITYATNTGGGDLVAHEYFTPDSVATELIVGPATVRTLQDAQFSSFAVMVHMPVASIKKAAIYTPDEIAKVLNAYPALTFAPGGSETKQISGFNCTKVLATYPNTGQTYEVWITNDISVPDHAIPPYYKTAGGFPVQYTAFQIGADGNLVTEAVTVNSVSNQKAPAGIFSIPDDYDKITKADMEAMGAGRQ